MLGCRRRIPVRLFNWRMALFMFDIKEKLVDNTKATFIKEAKR